MQKLCATPLSEEEKATSIGLAKSAAALFFAPFKKNQRLSTKMTPSPEAESEIDFCKAVSELTSDDVFCERHENDSAPLAMVALATAAQDRLLRAKDGSFQKHFDGLTFAVPPCHSSNTPQCHSTVGQKLLCVDWPKMFGLEVNCPDKNCQGKLNNDRSNFSR